MPNCWGGLNRGRDQEIDIVVVRIKRRFWDKAKVRDVYDALSSKEWITVVIQGYSSGCGEAANLARKRLSI